MEQLTWQCSPIEFFHKQRVRFYSGNTENHGRELSLFQTIFSMWRRLINFIQSLKTYGDLSPDLQLRRRVNSALHDRPFYSSSAWYRTFWQPLEVSSEIAEFVYQHLEGYSGLTVAHVLPSDRLIEDLSLPLVCWFDWEATLCDDFYDRFGVDISNCFDLHYFSTIEELVLFLNHQLHSVNYS